MPSHTEGGQCIVSRKDVFAGLASEEGGKWEVSEGQGGDQDGGLC